MSHTDASPRLDSTRTSRRSFVRLLGVGSLTTAAVALAACTAPAASPTPAPAVTQAPAKPTAPAATAPKPQTAATPSGQTQAPATPVEPITIKIGVPSFQFVNLPIHMGVEQKFFDEQRITLEILSMDATATIVKALIAQEINVGEMDAAAQISAIASGAPAKLIGSIRKNHHYMVAARNEINSLKDLEGKRIAVSSPNSAPNIILELLFKAENLDWSSTQQVSVGGSANRARALIANQVDATAFGVDEMENIEGDPNVKMLLLVKDVLPKYVGGGVIVNNDYIARPGVAERLMEGMLKSVRFCFENQDACVNLAADKGGKSRDGAAKTWEFFTKNQLWEPNGVITAEEIDYMQQVNLDLQTQDNKLPTEQIIDMTHTEKVLGRIGRYTPKTS